MDRDEVARRLERVRAVVREQLGQPDAGASDDTAPADARFHLRPSP